MRLAPSDRIVVVCKEYHYNGVASKYFRCACKSIILGRLLSARIVLLKSLREALPENPRP